MSDYERARVDTGTSSDEPIDDAMGNLPGGSAARVSNVSGTAWDMVNGETGVLR